jgi:seryl-tRNA synthetase
MLDIKFIREHKDLIKDAARKKHLGFDVDELLSVDDDRKALLVEVENMRAEQNSFSRQFENSTFENNKEDARAKMRGLKEKLQGNEERLKEVMPRWQRLMLAVPNIPDMSVPEGADDAENVEVRSWGEKPNFSFTPRSHIDMMKALDLADFERGAKVAGFRGYFLKNDGARLSFALWQFVLDEFVKKGFMPMIAPVVDRREAFLGTGYLPDGEDDLYKTQDDMYLAGTSEVPVMNYFEGEVVDAADLPIRIIAFSPCYRREAGSHGKDTKGLMRVHEFFKLEQVILCEASHAESVKLHEEITANAEEIMRRLNIPHHTVINCGGDLGLGQVKKYDIEAWVPTDGAHGTYRETHSASYFHDFQTRRLNIRYRAADGALRFAHSLNSTALPTPRILIPLIENNQQEDGSIMIPEVLEPYMGTKIIGGGA